MKARKKPAKPSKPEMMTVSIRMDELWVARLQQIAKSNERSVGAEIRLILSRYLSTEDGNAK